MRGKTEGWRAQTLLFLTSQSITLFGSTLVQMAIIWYVTLQTASGSWVAAFTVCSYLPQFFVSFIGGVWADRHSRKWLIVVSDAGIAAVTLLMLLLMPRIPQGTVMWAALLGLSALRSVGAGVQTPAVNAVIPQLVPEGQRMRYNGLNATMQSVVQFAAPAAAGALLSVRTLRATLLVDVVTAAVGIGLVLAVALPRLPASTEGASVTADMKNGLHYALSDRLIGRLLWVYGLFIFLSVPAGFLAQLLVSRVFGDTYWYLTAVELVGFAGMTGGGVLMSVWGGFRSRVTTLLTGLAAFGVLAVLMGLSGSFWLYLALMLLYGVALTTVQTATTTLIQERADEAMQGRVFGLLGTIYAGFLPLGMAVFGPLADRIPLQAVMIGSGVVLLLIAGVMRVAPSFRDQTVKK